MMKEGYKVLLVIMLALSLCCFAVACANDDAPQDGQDIIDDEQNKDEDQPDMPITPSIEEMTKMENVKEVNIYLNGVKNTVSLDDNISALLVEGLGDTLLAAAQDNTISNASTVDSVDELTKVYTCLEVVYNKQVDLPITQDNENLVADDVLYAIYANSNADNVLAFNGAIFGSINESNLSGIIEEYVLNNLQTTEFRGEQVTVAGITTTYLKDQSDDIDEHLLSQLLYNAIVFYQNCYNKDYQSFSSICTKELNAILDNNASTSDHGVDIILNMDQYFEYADPVSLQAVYDGHFGDYIVYINVDNVTTLSVVFIDEDGYPYIDACHLMSV